MYAPAKTWLPAARVMGMGQTASCPSLCQLQGCPSPSCDSDPCCNIGYYTTTCFDTTAGSTVACPISGTTVSGPPSTQGPFGQMGAISGTNWAILAAVLGGLVLVAALSGGR